MGIPKNELYNHPLLDEEGLNKIFNLFRDYFENDHTGRTDNITYVNSGNDFKVFKYEEPNTSKVWVVKKPRSSEDRPYDTSTEDFFEILTEDHEKIKRVLGSYMPETYIYCPNPDGNYKGYIIIQEYIPKEAFLSFYNDEELLNLIRTHRDLFVDFLENILRLTNEFGVPPDITVNNLAFHDDRLLYTENDTPSIRAQGIKNGKFTKKVRMDREKIEKLKEILGYNESQTN